MAGPFLAIVQIQYAVAHGAASRHLAQDKSRREHTVYNTYQPINIQQGVFNLALNKNLMNIEPPKEDGPATSFYIAEITSKH